MTDQLPDIPRSGSNGIGNDPTRLMGTETYGTWQDALIGKVLDGRYQVDELIGQGAMGAVFRGRQIRLRRPVALKIPRPELIRDPEFLARFEREALTMAKIVHENVVHIIDVCVVHDRSAPSFIAMELVQGSELEKYLYSERHNLTVQAVTDLFMRIARGIDAAHAHGVIHRDIKPGNIIVTMPQRVPKIMDFGIARAEMENVFNTTGMAAIGTPAYMAPEQVNGDRVTGAADIYSLAMTIYRLFSQSLPFEATTPTSLFYAHSHTPPIAIHARNPNLPKAMSYALARALEKDPEKRPPTACELVREVTHALEPLGNLPFGDLLWDSAALQTVVESESSDPSTVHPPPETTVLEKKRKRGWLYALLAIPVALVLGFCLAGVAFAVFEKLMTEGQPTISASVIGDPSEPASGTIAVHARADDLSKANDWAILLEYGKADPEKVLTSQFDVLVLNPTRDGTARGDFEPDQVVQLKGQGRIVLAYLEAGHANKTLGNWQPGWDKHPPPFLEQTGRGEDSIPVQYWLPAWREHILGDKNKPDKASRLDRILAQGFDGIVIGGTDIVEYWSEEKRELPRQATRSHFGLLVSQIAEQARSRNPDFLILLEGTPTVYFSSDREIDSLGQRLIERLDGHIVEGTFFRDGEKTPLPEVMRTTEMIDRVRNATGGKDFPVFSVDFAWDDASPRAPGNMARYALVQLGAYERRFVPYVGFLDGSADDLVVVPESRLLSNPQPKPAEWLFEERPGRTGP